MAIHFDSLDQMLMGLSNKKPPREPKEYKEKKKPAKKKEASDGKVLQAD